MISEPNTTSSFKKGAENGGRRREKGGKGKVAAGMYAVSEMKVASSLEKRGLREETQTKNRHAGKGGGGKEAIDVKKYQTSNPISMLGPSVDEDRIPGGWSTKSED